MTNISERKLRSKTKGTHNEPPKDEYADYAHGHAWGTHRLTKGSDQNDQELHAIYVVPYERSELVAVVGTWPITYAFAAQHIPKPSKQQLPEQHAGGRGYLDANFLCSDECTIGYTREVSLGVYVFYGGSIQLRWSRCRLARRT